MTISAVSTLAMRQASVSVTSRTQVRIEQATRELSSGRHHDVGLALGAATSRAIETRQLLGDIDAILGTNELAKTRLAATQVALTAISDIANGFFETVISVSQSGADRALLVDDARARLGALVDLLSSSSDGAYLFAGTNVTDAPLADYLGDPASPARAAVVGAFTTEFGFAPGDPQAATITAAQMRSYLDGSFSALFQDPAWQSAFSAANDEAIGFRISPREAASLSVNANHAGVRGLVSALVAAIDTGTSGLAATTFDVFATTIAERASAAAGDIVRMQAGVGVLQERLAKASERMVVERGILERTSVRLEAVDTLEVSTRLNHLATQLDVSYAVTARIQKLSLLDYL